MAKVYCKNCDYLGGPEASALPRDLDPDFMCTHKNATVIVDHWYEPKSRLIAPEEKNANNDCTDFKDKE
jgi:hypothetical protein